MRLTFTYPPRATRQAYLDSVQDFLGASAWNLEFALPVYTMGLNQISDKHHPENDAQTGWRLVSTGPSGAAILGELIRQAADQPFDVASVSQGDVAESALKTLRSLASYADCDTGSYEVRWLSIPGICTENIWLKALNPGEADIVIPFFTLDPELQAHPSFAMDGFMTAIQPLAQTRLAVDDEPYCH